MTAPTADLALNLLARYGWTPTGPATSKTVTLFPNSSEGTWPLGLHLYITASAQVGFSLLPYLQKPLEMRTYPLGKVKGGQLTALVYLSDGEIVGAHLSMDAAAPGLAALDERKTGLLAPAD